LNLVTPSKLGDLSKAAMLPGARPSARAGALGRAAIEKAADVAALLLLLAAGLCAIEANIGPLAASLALLALLGGCLTALLLNSPTRLQSALSLSSLSLALWILHLLQIDLFLRAAGVDVAWSVTFARIPLAIFAGLLPISFCGLGTRDTALIWLFADVAHPSTMAAVGMLTALRYLIPGAVGIPLLAGCWPSAVTKHGAVRREALEAVPA
jgi:hypothetical protein